MLRKKIKRKIKEKEDRVINSFLYSVPPKIGRYIVLDSETTGLKKEDHAIEIAAVELKDMIITGNEFQIMIKPRICMGKKAVKLHGITNQFYDDYYADAYKSEKQNLINFLNFLGDSIIFAHNTLFDIGKINSELIFWGLSPIPRERFRCSKRIFRDVIKKFDPSYDLKLCSLKQCCKYFGIKTECIRFHRALDDSHITAIIIIKLYEIKENYEHYHEVYFNNSEENILTHNFSNPRIESIKNKYKKYFIKGEKKEKINERENFQNKTANKVIKLNESNDIIKSKKILEQIFKDYETKEI